MSARSPSPQSSNTDRPIINEMAKSTPTPPRDDVVSRITFDPTILGTYKIGYSDEEGNQYDVEYERDEAMDAYRLLRDRRLTLARHNNPTKKLDGLGI